ncbi:MAG: L-2,4-diaminobutyric acid acetyltransferase [Pseudohongiellaceae bacterium]|jgi:L-2,4-diaminobutyric acid acetyltransferase
MQQIHIQLRKATFPMTENLTMRIPDSEDGSAIHDLASRCPPIDCNSLYCNLLQASHFRDTAIVAERQGEIRGYVTGYRLPAKQDTLFVWQVAVSPEARGQGLAVTMLETLLSRLPDVTAIETTVTPNNQSSMKLFHRLAERKNSSVHKRVLFDKEKHFGGKHEDEILLCIGPFKEKAEERTLPDDADIYNTVETTQNQFARMKARVE